MSKPIFQDWGLIEYSKALDQQLELVEILAQKASDQNEDSPHPGFIIFCTHPPVVTTGRQTKPEDIFAWDGDRIDISRGGRATYHGPSQIVVYPILNLKQVRQGRQPQEVRGYLRALETALIETLKKYEISATGKTRQKLSEEQIESDETGVWVGSQKIASLGIAIKKWITYHGMAINLDYDPEAYKGIRPCGFNSSIMTSVEQLLNKKVSREEFCKNLLQSLNAHL